MMAHARPVETARPEYAAGPFQSRAASKYPKEWTESSYDA